MFKFPHYLSRLLAALALSGLAVTASARTFDEIKKDGTIRVATEGAFQPFNYFEGAKLTGFEVELADAVFAKMGVKADWKAIGFDALLAGLQQNRWDFVVASHGITDERSKAVSFGNPHYCTGGIIVAKDPAIRTAKDLVGKTVSVQTGTTYLDQVKKLAGVKGVKNFPQDNDARNALQTGRVDAWVTDRFVATKSLATNPTGGLRMGDYVFVERIAAAASKSNPGLAQEWNKGLAAVVADGTYKKISDKWFKEDVSCK